MKMIVLCMACLFMASLSVAGGVDFGSAIKGDEAVLHVGRYGEGDPVTVSNGYLFIDWAYVPAPYTLRRVGQAAAVNGIVVNCLYKEVIPDRQERKVTGFGGEDGKKHAWKSPPHPSGRLRELADLHVSRLAELLSGGNAVFLSKARYKETVTRLGRPVDDKGMQRLMPMLGWTPQGGDKFSAMAAAVLADSEARVAGLFSMKTVDSRLGDEDTRDFLRKARADKAFVERLREQETERTADENGAR